MRDFLVNSFYMASNNSLLKRFGEMTRGPLTLLMYHRISNIAPSNNTYNPCDRLLNVSVENFENQIKFVRGNFNCISMSDAISQLITGNIKSNSLVITFDDGYADNYRLAAPILAKYSVPAIFYVCTDFPNKCANLWWYHIEELIRQNNLINFTWRGKNYHLPTESVKQKNKTFLILVDLFILENLAGQQHLMEALLASRREIITGTEDYSMTWEQIKELSQQEIFEIGAHTLTHQLLKNADEADVIHEMVRSKEIIEDHIGCPVKHFAYPFGYKRSASKREFYLAEQAGFSSAVTTRFSHVHTAHKDALHALPRIPILDMSLDQFKVRISGLESIVRQKGNIFVTD